MPTSNNSKNILDLHGAGKSNKDRTKYLSNLLRKLDVNMHSFDFLGFGGSSIPTTQSSLKIRQEQIDTVIKDLKLKEPLNVMGSSMGGYNAVKLLEKYSIANLFLFCPGLYTPAAFEVNFGSQFSKIIRQPNSWEDSDAFDLLSKYTGNLFVCIGENDEVIPKPLIQKIIQVSQNTKQTKLLTITNTSHKIHNFLENSPADCSQVVDVIKSFLKVK